jgi:glycosyltransferase involved in cell wall biosynthesis
MLIVDNSEFKEKVAIINSLGAHGSSFHFYIFGQVEGLVRAGVEVSIYTNNVTEDPNYAGVDFHQFYKNVYGRKSKLISGFKYILGSVFSLFHAKFNRVKICHFHLFHVNILVSFDFILSKILGLKVVYTIHDVVSFENSRPKTKLSNWMYQRVNKILIHNQFCENVFRSHYPKVKTEIDIIPHGNYIPFITIQKDKKKSREYLDLPTEKTILLFFGMIKKVKGLEVLLKALRKVVDTNPDIVLLIAGRLWKNDFKVYQKIITENNLSENIILHTHFVSHEDVKYYYSASDLIILPYKKIFQSGVLMMSMSYEKAVLVSDLDPLTEVVQDMKTGFVFESGNPKSLSEKLNRILLDSNKLEEVRINGLNHIKSKYDWLEIGKEMKKSYQSIL